MALLMTPPQTPRCSPLGTSTANPDPSRNALPQISWQHGVTFPVNRQLDSSEHPCQALVTQRMYRIEQVLDADSDAAWMPVSMDGLEIPVGAAIRLNCDLQVVKLLIARGAKLSMVNSHGQGPLSVLASCQCELAPDDEIPPPSSVCAILTQMVLPRAKEEPALRAKSRSTKRWRIGFSMWLSCCCKLAVALQRRTALGTLLRKWLSTMDGQISDSTVA